MAESIKQRVKSFKNINQQNDLKAALDATQTDLAVLRAAFLALTAKLDLDATIVATDFAATTNPVALSLTK